MIEKHLKHQRRVNSGAGCTNTTSNTTLLLRRAAPVVLATVGFTVGYEFHTVSFWSLLTPCLYNNLHIPLLAVNVCFMTVMRLSRFKWRLYVGVKSPAVLEFFKILFRHQRSLILAPVSICLWILHNTIWTGAFTVRSCTILHISRFLLICWHFYSRYHSSHH